MKAKLAIAIYLIWSFAAHAAELATLPPIVADHIRGMRASCEEIGGKPDAGGNGDADLASYRDELVEHAVLDKSHIEVWAIDEGRYKCDGAWSLFSGSGGSQIYVFARQKDGHVARALDIGANGISISKMGHFANLWLNVVGGWCGKPNFESNACAIQCSRSLVWNTKIKRLEFAPLSQAKNWLAPCAIKKVH